MMQGTPERRARRSQIELQ
jgi:ERCC4-related helicase